MEHTDLVQEMVLLEKLPAQERLKHSKRRRQQQLSNWNKREAMFENQNRSVPSKKRQAFLVQFPENIVLLEGKLPRRRKRKTRIFRVVFLVDC